MRTESILTEPAPPASRCCPARAMSFALEPLRPFGAVVPGLDLRHRPAADVLRALERGAASHGFLVFPNQTFPGAEFASVSRYFGGGRLAARHTEHAEAVHEEVLRLSNRPERGVPRVGPQWHHDGSFERRPFSHVAFHARTMPLAGGGTELADLATAYAALSPRRQREWARLASVNAYSGAVHPIVHTHPLSGRPVLFLHLGMTGAVVRWPSSGGVAEGGGCPRRGDEPVGRPPALEAMEPGVGPVAGDGYEVLGGAELEELLREYDALLTRHSTAFTYRAAGGERGDDAPADGAGDVVLLDNLAVAHRASAEAHDAGGALRVLDRTTVEGVEPLDPPGRSGLPPFLYIWGSNPLRDGGVWQGSDHFGVGFRWNRSLPMRN